MRKRSGGTAGFDNQLIERGWLGGITMTKSNHMDLDILYCYR